MKIRIQHIMTILATSLLFMACQDVEEPAYTIPTVKTDAVTNIGMRDAFVSGSVSSKSNCKFLLSTQQDLSDAIEINARCIDEEKGLYTGELSQLSSSTTYYVALCATDGYSEVKGNVQSFKTASCLSVADVTLADWDTGEQQPFQFALKTLLYTTTNGTMDYDATFVLEYGNNWYLSPNKEVGFGNETRRLFACYPWLDDITDVTKIHLYANKYDFVYGSSEELSETNPNAHIAMNHAMAKVTFEIKKSTDSNLNFTVGAVNLCNSWYHDVNAILFDGYFNLLTGKMSEGDASYGHDGLFINELNLELSATEVQTVDFYVIPTSFEDNDTMLLLYSKDSWSNLLQSGLGGATWSAGKHYIYPVTVTPIGLQIGDVRVEEWQNNNGGSIIINK